MLRYRATDEDPVQRFPRRPRNAAEHAAASQRRRKKRATLTLFWNNALVFEDNAQAVAHRLQVRPFIRHFRMVQLDLVQSSSTTTTTLSQNHVEACHAVWQALAACPSLKTIHVLKCNFGHSNDNNNHNNNEASRIIIQDFFHHLAQCKSLREIHLSFSFAGHDNVTALAQGLQYAVPRLSKTLRVLNITGNGVGTVGGGTGTGNLTLGMALANALQKLQQRKGSSGNHSSSTYNSSRHGKTTTSLSTTTPLRMDSIDVAMNRLGDAGVAPILRALLGTEHNSSNHPSTTSTTTTSAPPALPHARLWTLDLSDNQLTSASLPLLVRVMHKYQHSLRSLRLSFNPQLFATITTTTHNSTNGTTATLRRRPQAALDWIHALRQCRNLRELQVSDCGLDGGLASSIFASCEYFREDEDDEDDVYGEDTDSNNNNNNSNNKASNSNNANNNKNSNNNKDSSD